MNDDVILDGPRSLFLPPQAVATILDCLANGQFKVVNPVIALIMKQLREQEPKPKEVSNEDSSATARAAPDGVSDSVSADR